MCLLLILITFKTESFLKILKHHSFLEMESPVPKLDANSATILEQPDSAQDSDCQFVEIPTLKDTCLTYITKHVKKLDHILAHFFNGHSTLLLDTHLLAQVLLSSIHYMTVDSFRHMEALLPALTLEEECDQCWKKIVQKRYSVREISAPFPLMVKEVKELVSTLTSTSTSLIEKQKILDQLTAYPFSNELAKQTNVAMTVNSIRKDPSLPSSLTRSAAEITTKWKKIFKSQQSLSTSSTCTNNSSEASGSAAVITTGDVGMDCVHCNTWRELYTYYEQKEQLMLEKGAKRFSAMSNTERDKRKTSLSTKSNDISKHKKQKLQQIISNPNRAQVRPTVFRPSKTSLSASVLQSVKNTKGHSAVDLVQAQRLQSTKKMQVITTSSGGVMQLPRGLLQRNKR